MVSVPEAGWRGGGSARPRGPRRWWRRRTLALLVAAAVAPSRVGERAVARARGAWIGIAGIGLGFVGFFFVAG